MIDTLLIAGITVASLLLGAAFLHLLPRFGKAGRFLSEAMSRAPMLDLIITYFTIAPLVAGLVARGWPGLLGGVIGQVAAVVIWTVMHALAHPAARRGPRILKVINQVVGPWRNYTAVWITAIVVPMFWIVRMAEIFVYPLLVWLVRFPKYKHGDWINVSRHKFEGLVGHDLIWCLYCDWMTGVWSLGSEILRNVESFWCPIRFASDKKCENCRHDFPDLAEGWIAAGGSMAEVADLLAEKYTGPVHSWYGHPARLTVRGEPPEGGATPDKPK